MRIIGDCKEFGGALFATIRDERLSEGILRLHQAPEKECAEASKPRRLRDKCGSGLALSDSIEFVAEVKRALIVPVPHKELIESAQGAETLRAICKSLIQLARARKNSNDLIRLKSLTAGEGHRETDLEAQFESIALIRGRHSFQQFDSSLELAETEGPRSQSAFQAGHSECVEIEGRTASPPDRPPFYRRARKSDRLARRRTEI